MTKDEMIDAIIERYKGFENKGRINIFNCCPEIDCDYCPFECRGCTNDIAMSLLERLVKAEKKKETNLDHYIIRSGVGITMENDCEKWEFQFKKGTEKQYFDANSKSVLDWLLSSYEEPKPKFKLTKFEYDLVDFCKQYNDTFVIEDWAVLMDMHDKGHFKGIPTDVPVKDILENCEVAEE